MRLSELAGGALGALIPMLAVSSVAAEVNLYTTREPGLVQPLIEAFTASTGIAVNTIFVQTGMAERVKAEGRNSPADVMMTVDIGNLIDLVDAGVSQPIHSEALEAAIPEDMRDPDGNWFALSMRARVLYVAKDLGIDSMTYEDLADPYWKGRICIRSGQHPYNTALIAAFITRRGPGIAENWLTMVKNNLARRPGGGDREVARDILGGLCDIGVGNSYYVGLMRSGAGGPEQKKWGDAIDVILPTFVNGGTHVNISGASIARYAPHRDDAVRFLEFLISDEGQKLYAQADFEYPIKPGVWVDPIIASLGEIWPDPIPIAEIATHRKQASELVDRIGFDN
jgi:iron(III) transport system substrate-binding protein